MSLSDLSSKEFLGTDRYVASESLKDIVNIALKLEKPLLVRGEPGTGKTLLAAAASEGLGLPLIRWHVKSTTKAQDGLYVYDTIQRLNDSRFGSGDVNDLQRYIKLGPLGQAFQADQRVVVLIDEIDKADIEFPNDLLHELDAMEFTVAETQQRIVAKHRPLVIITSNAEKELPDAFLRRCIFHYIAFPEPELMAEIIRVHHPDLEHQIINHCLQRFYSLRDNREIRKPPSTSELIDWIWAIRRGGIDISALQKNIPFLGILLKKEQDLSAMERERKRPSGRR